MPQPPTLPCIPGHSAAAVVLATHRHRVCGTGAEAPLVLSYEQLLADPLDATRRIFAFLGLQPCEVDLRRATRRIGGGSVRTQVSNWASLCAPLRRRGVASQLWQEVCHALREGGSGSATSEPSPDAIPAVAAADDPQKEQYASTRSSEPLGPRVRRRHGRT